MAWENVGRVLDHAKQMQIRRLSLSGFSERQIARIVGVAKRTVRKYKPKGKARKEPKL